MKNTNLKKKNSLGKIIGMKINDYSWHIKFFSSILITIVILISPVFISNFKWCTGLAILTALIISILVIWLLFAIIKFFIINSISLSRVRYIPLTENEVKDNQLDTIEKYAEFINNLVTCKEHRCLIPYEIAKQVIEFSDSYYYATLSVIDYHNYNDYEVHNKYLMYEPYMDDNDFRNCPFSHNHRYKHRKTFIVCDEEKKYNTIQMRDYLKENPMLAEKWNLDLGKDITLIRGE